MDSFLKDIRYGVRSLMKRPTLTIIAVITLAIGIGANSAIFSVVNALLIKPLPFPELERVVAVWETQPSRGVLRNEASMANYLDWRSQNQTFEQMGLYRWWSASLTGIDTPERIQGFLVTGNFLDVLKVKPVLGEALRQMKLNPVRIQLQFSHMDCGNAASAAIPESSTKPLPSTELLAP